MSMAEQTTRRPQQRERRLPKFNAMAKVGNGWVRIGAAWEVKSGENALSVQLTSIPVNWDGRFSLFEPNTQEATEQPQQ